MTVYLDEGICFVDWLFIFLVLYSGGFYHYYYHSIGNNLETRMMVLLAT